MKEETIDAFQVLWGKDKHENFELIDLSNPNDIWFHADGIASSHVVLQNPFALPFRSIPRSVLKRCAAICKKHSHASSGTKISIVYCYIKHVLKTKYVGEVTLDSTECRFMLC